LNRTLLLPAELRAELASAAQRSFPNECCGLIEGVDTAQGWRALKLHEAGNLADDPEAAFLVDPQVQFDLLRSLRNTERRIIGCFHSHPNGRPEPSARDRQEAAEDGFLWLIASLDKGGEVGLKAFVFGAARTEFEPVDLALRSPRSP
jgi:proteasome lid subunit RPN8/RPN11